MLSNKIIIIVYSIIPEIKKNINFMNSFLLSNNNGKITIGIINITAVILIKIKIEVKKPRKNNKIFKFLKFLVEKIKIEFSKLL